MATAVPYPATQVALVDQADGNARRFVLFHDAPLATLSRFLWHQSSYPSNHRRGRRMRDLRACHCCGLIHRIPELGRGERAVCVRCQAEVCRGRDHQVAKQRTIAAALSALILYWPATLLPILEIERLGHRYASSLLGGTLELLRHGNWFVGLVVLLFSLVFPLAKIMLLLELCWLGILHRRHKAFTYRLMEQAGKWSMLDVMLLALLVMLIKLGNLVQFQFGPAVVAFVLCVVLSVLASMSFDPHVIWKEDP